MFIRFYQSIRRREQRTSRAWQTFNPTNESLGHTIALIGNLREIKRNVFYVRYRMGSSVGSCIQNNSSWWSKGRQDNTNLLTSMGGGQLTSAMLDFRGSQQWQGTLHVTRIAWPSVTTSSIPHLVKPVARTQLQKKWWMLFLLVRFSAIGVWVWSDDAQPHRNSLCSVPCGSFNGYTKMLTGK